MGGDEQPSSLCVAGGLVRGLHPNELSTATRVRQAFDALIEGAPHANTPVPQLEPSLRGFRVLQGGFVEALREALTLARADGTRAPLLLLVQGASPLATVLQDPCFAGAAGAATLRELVVVLGDQAGLDDDEVELVSALGAEVAGGGPVFRASLGHGALLASQCIVITHHYLDAIHDCPSQLWDVSPEVRHTQRQRQRRMKKKTKRERQQTTLRSTTDEDIEDHDAYRESQDVSQ